MADGLKGIEALKRSLRARLAGLESDVADVCAKSAETVRARVVLDINRQTPNPAHKVPAGAKGRRRHIPSPPGSPPNADTGRLSASYTTSLQIAGPRIAARIVAGVRYALWLEFGTRKMQPRPHLLPRFREYLPTHRDGLRKALRRRFGGGNGRRG